MNTVVFIPGLPRCATTSLVNLLFQHPSVYHSTIKEPHYFARAMQSEDIYFFDGGKKVPAGKNGFLLDEKSYQRNYENFSTGKSHYVDASTLYSVYPESIAEIARWMPDGMQAKFIVLVREPMRRAVSHYKFNVARNEEPHSFLDALRQEIAGEREQWLLKGYAACSYPAAVLAEIVRVFGEKSLLLINIDECDLYGDEGIGRVSKFLDLPDYDYDTNIYENRSDQVSNKYLNLIRIFLKKTRATNPLLFDNKFTRAVFTRFMAVAADSSSSVEVDLTDPQITDAFTELAKKLQ